MKRRMRHDSLEITDSQKLSKRSTEIDLSQEQQSRISQILNSTHIDDKTKFILLTSMRPPKKSLKPMKLKKDFYFTNDDQPPKGLKKSN